MLAPGDLVLVKSSIVDHLERLQLARVGPHACWKERCKLKKSCGDCAFRLVPSRRDDRAEPATEGDGAP